jgi:hypothetical protein
MGLGPQPAGQGLVRSGSNFRRHHHHLSCRESATIHNERSDGLTELASLGGNNASDSRTADRT